MELGAGFEPASEKWLTAKNGNTAFEDIRLFCYREITGVLQLFTS
ncbi:hypothetical protein ACFS5N_07420 [Mucilaginibacter ximonensis]|uniref:Uncharacterized protein n=1 Tax=Mucilaginibacter ximonensis TaxID=538021 RepID=A0ABW5YA79_9SPHI